MNVRSTTLAALFLATTACTHRAPSTYRYIKQDNARFLIPPGVVDTTTSSRSFTIRTTAPHRPACTLSENGVDIRTHKRDLRITVNRQPLLATPPGWLATWTGSLEKRDCLAPHEALPLATRIAEALPMDPAAANALLHPDLLRRGSVDLGPHHRLKVVSPIRPDGTAAASSDLEITGVTGKDRALTVDLKSSSGPLGYETAWWTLEPRPDRIGVHFIAGPAEARIGDKLTQEARPRFNYFQFAPDAAYFRLFFLTRLSRADHDIAIVSAPTVYDLDERTARLEEDPGVCGTPAEPQCILIPRLVAVVPHIAVTVNGKEVAIPAGCRLRDAIVAAGEKNPQRALATLVVQRFYAGLLTGVDFDRAEPDILNLPLNGGENIRF